MKVLVKCIPVFLLVDNSKKRPQNQLRKAAELVNSVMKQTTAQTDRIAPIQK